MFFSKYGLKNTDDAILFLRRLRKGMLYPSFLTRVTIFHRIELHEVCLDS